MNTFSPDSYRGSDESGDSCSLYDFIFFLFPSLLVVLMFVVIVLRHVMSVAWFLLLQKLRPTDINSLKECCKIKNNLLGKGTYGNVYRGTFENKSVAIKQIEQMQQPEQYGELKPEEMRKTTKLEVELLSQFHSHKNVISLVTFFEDVDYRCFKIKNLHFLLYKATVAPSG